MTAASKEQVHSLHERYDIEVEEEEGLMILDYAFIAWLLIAAERIDEGRKTGDFPEIWQCRIKDNPYVYLVLDGVVYGNGVTSPVEIIPNISYEDLQAVGEDITYKTIRYVKQVGLELTEDDLGLGLLAKMVIEHAADKGDDMAAAMHHVILEHEGGEMH